jgi:hypothetical protein
MSKRISYTIADIVARKGVSERTAIRKMSIFPPDDYKPGYMGRSVRAWNREQVDAAFPKKGKGGAN